MSLIRMVLGLLVVVMLVLSSIAPFVSALSTVSDNEPKYYDIEIEKKSTGVLASIEGESNEVIQKLLYGLLTNVSKLLMNTGDEFIKIKPVLVDPKVGSIKVFTDTNVRAGGSIPSFSDSDEVFFIPMDFKLKVSVNAGVNKVNLTVLLLSVYIADASSKKWYVASSQNTTHDGINTHYNVIASKTKGSGTLSVTYSNVPMTSMLYGITFYNNVSTDRLYLYFNIDKVTVSFVATSSPTSHRVMEKKLSELDDSYYVTSEELWPTISNILTDYYNSFKTSAISSLKSQVDPSYRSRFGALLNQHMNELDQEFDSFIDSISSFKVKSKGIVDQIKVTFEGSINVDYFKVINTTDSDVKYEKKDLSYSTGEKTKHINRDDANIGGYSEDEALSTLKEVVGDTLGNYLAYASSQSVTDYDPASESPIQATWYPLGYEYNKDTGELIFGNNIKDLDIAYLMRYNETYFKQFNPDKLIPYSQRSSEAGKQGAFILINAYPYKDPNIWAKNSFSTSDRVFIDFYSVNDRTSTDTNGLVYLVINGVERSESEYSHQISKSGVYTTTSGELEYTASISSSINIRISVEYSNYYLELKARKLLDEVDVNINTNSVPIPTKDEVANNSTMTGSITVIPALAPIKYDGIPTKIGNLISYISPEMASKYTGLKNDISNNFLVQLASKAVFPTYLPLPLPERAGTRISLELNRFAPGEYLGGYAIIKSNIDMKAASSIVRSLPGVSVVTLFFEEIKVEYTGGDSYVSIDSSGVKYHNGNSFTILTLGLGIGSPGSAIGYRFYVFPSASVGKSNLNESSGESLFRKVLGNDKVRDVISFIGDIFGIEGLDQKMADLVDHGAYLNFLVYLGNSTNRDWFYIPFTIKNTNRFIVKNSGELRVYVKNVQVYHVKVFKIPIIGIPVPVPVPLYIYMTNSYDSAKCKGSVAINVYRMGVLPLFMVADEIDLTKYKGLPPKTAIEKALSEHGISIYALPVWIDDEGKPIGPVLLRGPYGESGSISSLGVALVDSKTGKILGHAKVNDLGFSLESIRVSYNELRKIGYDEEAYLMAIWYRSGSVVKMENQEIPYYDKLKILPPSLMVIHSFSGEDFLVYVGARHKVSIGGGVVEDYINMVEQKINEYKNLYDQISESIRDQVESFYNNFTGTLDKYSDPEQLVSELKNIFKDIVDNILEQILKSLAQQLIAKVTSTIATALAPDPTGGIVSSMIQEAIERIVNSLFNQLVPSADSMSMDEIIGRITDALTRYAVSYILSQIIDYIENSGTYSDIIDLINQTVTSATEKIFEIIDTADEFVNNLTNTLFYVLEMMKNYLYYYPVFFSRMTAYNPVTFDKMSSTGFVSDKFLLPIDKIHIEDCDKYGAIVLVEGYNVQEFILNRIGEILNVDSLKNIKGQVVFWGFLMAVGAWANYLGDTTGIDKLHSLGNGAFNVANNSLSYVRFNIGKWVTVYGLDADLYYPTITYIPPVKI